MNGHGMIGDGCRDASRVAPLAPRASRATLLALRAEAAR